MKIIPKNDRFTVVLGDYVKADSNVELGGGADNTEKLQAVLNKASEWGDLHLIVDGAYLTRTLRVHSNTKIECKNPDCGFFLANNTDYALFMNKNHNFKNIVDKNIEFKGGTFNLNCNNQKHHVGDDLESHKAFFNAWNHGFRFYGVENFIMRDVIICDQTAFAMFKNKYTIQAP